MQLADELKSRGLIEHSSSSPEEILKTNRTAYLGIDPTADSLHVGHLVPILLMKRLGDAGHRLIFIVGGGTGMIGDPREKGERPLLNEKIIRANTRAIARQIKGVLNRVQFRMVDNAQWLLQLKLIPFLRDIGKHFTVNELVKRDLIARRLATQDESISYTEFTYALLQAYDFLTLNKKHGCDLQIGAADQWTNILSGVDLVRKKEGKQVFALTVPLVTDSSGKKFGKSEGNAVWLDPRKTSPFQFYQFWIGRADADVERYLNMYTFLPLTEISALMELHKRNPGERQAQKTLARLVTEIVHGPAAAAEVTAASDGLFGGVEFQKLSPEAKKVVLAEAPSYACEAEALKAGIPLVDALTTGGLSSSKSDARRLIESKAVSLNGMTIQNPEQKIYRGDLPGGHGIVRKGKQGVLILVLK